MAKVGRHKNIMDRAKKYKQNGIFQNNEQKFYKQVGGEGTKTNQLWDAKETKQFLSKIWEENEDIRKSDWEYNMKKEIYGLADL